MGSSPIGRTKLTGGPASYSHSTARMRRASGGEDSLTDETQAAGATLPL